VPHRLDLRASRNRNRLFYQRLLHSDPHVAQHQLQQILRLQRSSPAQ